MTYAANHYVRSKKFPDIQYSLTISGYRVEAEAGCHMCTFKNLTVVTYGVGGTLANIIPDTPAEKDLWGNPKFKYPLEDLAAEGVELVCSPEVRKAIYDPIIDALNHKSLVMMTAPINYGLKKPVARVVQPTWLAGIASFVDYLRENEIGHLTATPIVTNPMHMSETDMSFVRGWWWIPPRAAKLAIGRTGYRMGQDTPPRFNDWLKEMKLEYQRRGQKFLFPEDDIRELVSKR